MSHPIDNSERKAPRMLLSRAGLLAAIVCVVALSGNHPTSATRCVDLYARGEYSTASTVCERQFAATRSPQAGITAARSVYQLGQRQEVFRWLERLRGTKEEANAWYLAGSAHLQQQEKDRSKNAYLTALRLHRAAGDSKGAAESLYRLFYVSWLSAEHRDSFVFAAQAFEEAARAHDSRQELVALQGLLTAFYEIGDLENARHVLEKLESLTPSDAG